jgi:3-oxoacyl-ACP reductase-like protein
MGKFEFGGKKEEAPAKVAAPAAVATAPAGPVAPGTAGELKLYDTDPRDAAMIMAIVADELGKPLNELRFTSIREVRK